jgi:hypothetical protein
MALRKSYVWLIAVALVASACGGSESEPGTTAPAETTTAAPGDDTTTTAPGATTEAPDETTTTAAEAPSGDIGEGVATVTVGDTTYDFEVAASIVGRCDPDFFGAFWVIASMADGSGGLEMFIIPEGNTNHDETSKIKVNAKDADERDWRADADGGEGTPEGESSVNDFEIDGNTVTGTASFVDIYQPGDEKAEGTFTATCP